MTTEYDGPQDTKVVVAAFKSLPPMNAPEVVMVVDENQGFPVTVELSEVPGSTCQILAFMAKGGNPTFPSTADPKAESQMITLDGSMTELNLTLIEP